MVSDPQLPVCCMAVSARCKSSPFVRFLSLFPPSPFRLQARHYALSPHSPPNPSPSPCCIVAEVPASQQLRDVIQSMTAGWLDGCVAAEQLQAQVLAQAAQDPGGWVLR